MSIFPFMQKIDDKSFLVIGSGAVARRKVRLLLQFTDRITLVTHIKNMQNLQNMQHKQDLLDKKALQDKQDLQDEQDIPDKHDLREIQAAQELSAFRQAGVDIQNRLFEPEDLKQADYCIASCDDKAENSRIAGFCHEDEIPVNVPDSPDLCTFFMPSVIKKGDLVITVSTGGKSPAMSAGLRRSIETILPDRTEEILDRMAELRTWVPEILPHSQERGRLYTDILNGLMEGKIEPAEEEVRLAAEDWVRKNS